GPPTARLSKKSGAGSIKPRSLALASGPLLEAGAARKGPRSFPPRCRSALLWHRSCSTGSTITWSSPGRCSVLPWCNGIRRSRRWASKSGHRHLDDDRLNHGHVHGREHPIVQETAVGERAIRREEEGPVPSKTSWRFMTILTGARTQTKGPERRGPLSACTGK